MRLRFVTLFALPAALPSCLCVDVASDPVPDRVFAEFDPGAERPLIPIPNDLAVDPATGMVAIPPELTETEAERQLAVYFAQLDGYPPDALASATFSGPLDESSLIGAISLFDVTEPASLRTRPPDFSATWDGASRRVFLQPNAPFSPGHVYGVVVRSHARGGVRDQAGKPVLAMPAFYFLRGREPLVTCRDLDSPTCESVTEALPTRAKDPDEARAERREVALALERIRLSLQPVLEAAAAAPLPAARDEIVLAWKFRISTMPTARFDLTDRTAELPIPFPHDILRPQGRLDVPLGKDDPEPLKQLKLKLGMLDGFSTTAAIRAGVVLPLLPGAPAVPQTLAAATLTPASMPLAPVGTVAPEYDVGWEPETTAVIARPRKPLRSKALYIGALTSDIRTEPTPRHPTGRPLRAPFIMALLRLTAPLAKDGVSQIRGIPDAQAVEAEAARMAFAPAYALYEAQTGASRDEVAVLFPFSTQTVSETLPDLWALPEKMAVDTAASGTLYPPDVTYGLTHVDSMVEGEMTTPVLLDAFSGSFPTDWTKTRLERVPYIIAQPKCVPPGRSKPPVAVVLHALGRFRRDLLAAADSFAAECWALAGIDLPYHGGRSICLLKSDCDGGECDFNTRRCSGSGLKLSSDGNPITSGIGFINPDNLFAIRDNMRQSVIDTAQFLRVLAAGPPGSNIDASDPTIVGTSMGGMIATMVLAAAPQPRVGVFTTTAANVIDTLLTSSAFGPARMELDKNGITPGTRAFREFELVARWIFDPAEPANYAELVTTRSLTHAITGKPIALKKVLVQMGVKDDVMLNRFTQLLARLLGVTNLGEATFPNAQHNALFSQGDPDWPRITAQAARFVSSQGAVVLPP